MIVLALIVVAGAAMGLAWALHPRWARQAATAGGDERTLGGHWHRFVDRLQHVNLPSFEAKNGHSNGNGATSLETVLEESPAVSPSARDDIDDDGQVLEGFDLRSVARFSIRFFGCVFAAFVMATFALWVLASVLGLVGDFERFMRGIGFTGFRFLSIQFLLGLALIGIAFWAVMVVLTCVTAALYNVLAYRWEGVRVYLSDAGARTTRAKTRWKAADDASAVSSSAGDATPDPPPRGRARTRRALTRGGPRARS